MRTHDARSGSISPRHASVEQCHQSAGRLAVAQEPTNRFVVRLPPPEAERVTRGVGIHLVSFGRSQIVGRLQQARAERDCLGVGSRRVVDVQIEMDLLGDAIGPIRRNMVGRELHAEYPSTVCVDHAVPIGIHNDAATQHSRPERALGGQISCVEHDYLPNDLHAARLP